VTAIMACRMPLVLARDAAYRDPWWWCVMQRNPRPAVAGPVIGAMLLAVFVLLVVSAVVPDSVLLLLLLAGVLAEVILYGVLYAVELRRHW
jgi:hypothetical protein